MPDAGQVARVDHLASAGYAARGVVYLLLGYYAVMTRAGADDGQSTVFRRIADAPGGGILVWLLAAGLAAYGLYKLASTFLDTDHRGHGWKARATRLALALGGLAYFGLAWTAVRIAPGVRRYRSSEEASEEMAATVLDYPLGEIVLILAGLAFVVVAGAQLRTAWTKHFMRRVAANCPPFTCTLGRIGLAARGVVFGLVGWSLLRGGIERDEDQVRDLGGVLDELQQIAPIYLAVCAGLLIFGLYSLVLARYRIVPPVDPIEATREKVAEKLA